MAGVKDASPRIYSIGHSNRPIDKFLALLKAHAIKEVVDVRTIPRSRHNPQFNEEDLKLVLRKNRVGYRHLKELGGLRHAAKDSRNLGWQNLSFRGFADYMADPQFELGLEKLEKIALKKRTAIMCAEGRPFRCHRSLIADALKKRKWKVFHIQSRITAKPHEFTPFLRTKGGKLFYPKQKGA
ncbi:MAG TPA: DUF488 domain-containing protein [Candidatus Tyrphobacter sp.]|nr:DUF488 domain-containing protein [Candidatus Tyrphobacter sp.]